MEGPNMSACNLCWTQSSKNLKFRGKLSPMVYSRQAFNHFENHSEISNKMNLFQNLRRLCAEHNRDVFNFLPLTFDYNLDSEDFEQSVGHFFRFFKALRMSNLLDRRPDLAHVPDGDFLYLLDKFGSKSADAEGVSNRTFFLEQMGRRVGPPSVEAEFAPGSLASGGKRGAEADWAPRRKKFNLNHFYLRILHENLKKEGPSTDFRGEPINPRLRRFSEGADQRRKRLFKRLLRVLDYPCAAEDDQLEKLLSLGKAEAGEEAESPGRSAPGAGPSPTPRGKKAKGLGEDLHLKNRFEVQKERRELVLEAKRKWEMGEIKSKFKASLFDKARESLAFPKDESRFCGHYGSALASSFNAGRNIWLLKVTSYNRGFGIELFADLGSFVKHLFNFSMGYEERLPGQGSAKRRRRGAGFGRRRARSGGPKDAGALAGESAAEGCARQRRAGPRRHKAVEDDDHEQESDRAEVHRAAAAVRGPQVRHPAVPDGEPLGESVHVPRHVHPRVGLPL